MVEIPFLQNIDWFGVLAQAMYYIGYGLIMGLVIGIFGFLAYIMLYNIKVDVYPVYGSGTEGNFYVGKRKSNRVRWGKGKKFWKPLHPLFNKKELQPFTPDCIYPGNKVIAFDYNGDWIPAKINFSNKDNKWGAEISPVPYHLRNWQTYIHKKNSQEFAPEQSFWDENKTMIIGLIACGLCCLAGIITVYLSYRFATIGRSDISALTSAINSLAQGKILN